MAKKGFIAEFKEFIARGNVMDLAVGVIIGGAFQSIVNSLVNDMIMPVISLLTGGVNFSNWVIRIGSGENDTIKYGNFTVSLAFVTIHSMDIQMPKMDGYMTTREIRTLKNNKKANIPIVAMTANAFEEDKKKAFKAGMNAHIAKPIDINTILAVFDLVFGTS